MLKLKQGLLLITLLLSANQIVAKNLGVIGEVWPIQERSMLELLEARAAKINQEALKAQWQKRVRSYAERPDALPLSRTDKSTQHSYEPVVNVNRDIVAPNGHLIVKAGTSVNALARLPFYKPELLFFNGEDKAQLKWALKTIEQFPQAKLILTGGSISEMESLFHRPIFFDQKGVLTKKFKITHVPAHAHRQGLSILIDEVAIKEHGDER